MADSRVDNGSSDRSGTYGLWAVPADAAAHDAHPLRLVQISVVVLLEPVRASIQPHRRLTGATREVGKVRFSGSTGERGLLCQATLFGALDERDPRFTTSYLAAVLKCGKNATLRYEGALGGRRFVVGGNTQGAGVNPWGHRRHEYGHW